MQLGAESGFSCLPDELDWKGKDKDKYNILISRSSGHLDFSLKFLRKTYIQDLKTLIGESLEIFADSWYEKL